VLRKGFITFGSFNMLNKMSEPVVSLWSSILLKLPTAKLFLKANGLTEPQTQSLILKRFAAYGITEERLIIKGRQNSFESHMSMYNDVDIGLDPFPYNGTTTTCEALSMGVPIVTLAGRSHVSRVGVSIMSNMGLPEFIAPAPEEYIRIAFELAGDISRLSTLRHTMRDRMQASPLMQPRPFMNALESAYRQVWRERCLTPPP
jgi:predicted O-linked N-acetylglucosamine transferase (SPINDLY family)